MLGARCRGRRLGAHATPLEQVVVHPALDLQPPTTFAGSVTAIRSRSFLILYFFLYLNIAAGCNRGSSLSRESVYVFFSGDE